MSERINLLLITTDQQRFDTIGRAGNPSILTPHLNWLADTGVLCRRAYTDAPICCAARATMITGRHYRNLGSFGNWGQPTAPDVAATLPSILTRHGYQTRSVGKVHYNPPRCNYGFEHMEILEDYYRFVRQFPERGIPMDHGVGQNEMEPVISTVEESWSLTRWIVDRAINFLETRDTSRPFFLNIGFSKPHPPWDPCLNYWQLYANMNVPEPVFGDWSKNVADIPAGFMGSTWQLNGVDQFSAQLIQQARRAYYACITQIDYNLGYFFARLRELGLNDNTLVIFTSDHGEMLGDHHLGAKTVFLEGSAHVPMLVRGPSHLVSPDMAGTQSDALVCLADLLPTFLNAAGVPASAQPPGDGLDLIDVLHQRLAPRSAFVGAYGHQFCLIRDRHKYVYTSAGGGELLFNLADDPLEQRNLAGLRDCADLKARLRSELADTLARSGHPVGAGGELQVIKPAPKPQDMRRLRWPGLHSRDTRDDLLH